MGSNQPSTSPGQCGSDREIFARVWRRVMPEDRPDCPIVLLDELPPEPCAPPAEAPTSLCAGEGAPEEGQDVPLLGAASARYAPALQAMIAAEMVSARTYRALSRRMQGTAAKTIAGMAADERRHAKRLSAACFLISGVRYLPPDAPLSGRPDSSPVAALRRAFADEQRAEALYQAAAAECADPCLTELFRALAGEEAAHRDAILGLLEQM